MTYPVDEEDKPFVVFTHKVAGGKPSVAIFENIPQRLQAAAGVVNADICKQHSKIATTTIALPRTFRSDACLSL